MIRRAALRVWTATALFVTIAAAAHAATPASLVRDLHRQPGPNLSSNPSAIISLGDRALFWARTPLLGNELYRTDGTAAGTSLIADLCPGPCDSGDREGFAIAGRAFFFATDGARGSELWTSDGTAGGTRPLLDVGPGPAVGVYNFPRDGGDRLLFETSSASFDRLNLWSSDGTVAGTVRFAQLADGGIVIPGDAAPGGPLPGGRRFYLFRFNSTDSLNELWETDGTAAGTRRVLALPTDTGESICSLDLPRVATGDFYFAVDMAATGCELWRVKNGVAAPFVDIGTGALSSNPRSFVRQGDWTLFSVDVSDRASELWTTDGTVAGTVPAGPSTGTSPLYLGSNSAHAYFAAETPEKGRELWVADGPPGTFRLLADLVPGRGSSNPQAAGEARDRVFFWTHHPDRGTELQAASPGDIRSVARVREQGPIGGFAAVGQRAVFGADLGLGLGVELAVTDGFPESTGLLRDLAQGDPSSNPQQLTPLADRLLFTATDDGHGGEVWRTDGTNAGTELVADLTRGHPDGVSSPLFLAPTASGVVLEAPDGSIRHAPARSGGIDLLFRSASEGGGSNPGFRLGAKALFFTPVGDADRPRFELWRADGRPAGSRRLAEIAGSDRFFGYQVAAAVDPLGHRAFFIPQVTVPFFGPFPVGLWVTDGTVAGTRRVIAQPCDGCLEGIGDSIVGPGGNYFFAADDLIGHVSRLWVSDGTSAEAVILAELPNIDGGYHPIRSLARLGEMLVFAASDPEHGQELWVSDGTPVGTRRLTDLRPGPAPSWPDGITVVGDRAFFSADDGVTGRELWATDGTEEGTYRVADLRRGARSSVPQELAAIGNRLVFAADDGKHGLEVWSSDGTAAGTRLASDVQVGRLPSSPSDFVELGSDLLFVASRTATGRELFRLPLSALSPP